MAEFAYERAWKNEKTAFERSVGRKKPSRTFLGAFKRSTGLSSALRSFDRADDLKGRQKAYQTYVKARTGYAKTLEKAKSETTDTMVLSKVDDLLSRLADLQDKMEKEVNAELSAAPKPVGKVYPFVVLRKFDLLAGISSVHLDLEPMWVEAHAEIDKAFEALVDERKEGFKVARLGEAAQKVSDKYADALAATIDKVDIALTAIVLEGGRDAERKMEAKRREVENVLEVTRRQCEKQMNEAVARAWKQISDRQKALKGTRLTITVGILSAGANISLNAAHIVATGGATWLGVISMAKGVVDLSHAIADGLKDIDDYEEELEGQLKKLHTLGTRKQKEWYKLNPTVAKGIVGTAELAAWGSYAAFARAPSFTRAQFLLGAIEGEVSRLETRIDKAVGKLNKLLATIQKGERKLAQANKLKKKTEIEDKLALLRVAVVQLLDELGALAKVFDGRLENVTAQRAFLEDLQKMDIHQPAVMKTGMAGAAGVTVGGAAWTITEIVTAVV